MWSGSNISYLDMLLKTYFLRSLMLLDPQSHTENTMIILYNRRYNDAENKIKFCISFRQ